MPRGGPDGGDGGRGGDVVVLADPDLRDLSFYRSRRQFKAGRGGHGEGSQRHGARGRRARAARPGRNRRRGSRRPASGSTWSTRGRACRRRARRAAGAPATGASRPPRGRRRASRSSACRARTATLELRLKLLADVGLVGAPERGQVLAAARLTRAAPKVGDYPFTTLEPALGTLERRRGPPARARRHPGADRGRGRGRGARPRVPRPRRAHVAARPSRRRRAARRRRPVGGRSGPCAASSPRYGAGLEQPPRSWSC